VLAVVSGRDLAVATSGTAERGAHIVDPRTGGPADGPASVTVVGASLTRVDALATAAFVMGDEALPWLEGLPAVEGLVVSGDGAHRRTSGWADATAP
jgi:thiamine biosynthesis lipoprotein